MHTYLITKGTTNVSIELEIIDSTAGTPETGVVWNTSGIDLQYRRDGAVSTAITEATLAALTTAHTDGGFLHIGNGVYRFDLPDAACASGVDKVVVHGTVTGMVVIPVCIQLTDIDIFDAVRGGMTALPNAAADAAGGLAISDAGGLDLDTKLGYLTGDAFARLATYRLGELMSAALASQPFATSLLGDLTQDNPDAAGTQQFTTAALMRLADEVLTGSTHNINNSWGKRVRQIDAAFEVHSGTAQAGAATTITLDTGASASDDIYRGDRIIIVAGTGVGEHDICTAYNGTTKVATVAETWIITPDATSEFVLVPASVDVETWQHAVVSNGATSGLPAVDSQAISDNAAAADNVQANIGNLDAQVSLQATVAKQDAQDLIITEARLAELDAANLPAVIDAILAMLDDPRAEPGQGAPAVNADMATKLDYLYKAWRNLSTQTATTYSLYNDAGTVVDQKSTVSDDTTTFTKGEVSTGP